MTPLLALIKFIRRLWWIVVLVAALAPAVQATGAAYSRPGWLPRQHWPPGRPSVKLDNASRRRAGHTTGAGNRPDPAATAAQGGNDRLSA
ncbi:hypothetical protein [Sodalis sp. (in: enterobacteria)]|uniref:hypothetical protein n=1 Tax=Sodalis sp. (in: enterobacteria) TaxID=1898979 RepID=UPI003F68549B